MLKRANHTPITGTPDIRTAMNTALGELDAALGGSGVDAGVIGESVASGTNPANASTATWNVRRLQGLEVDGSSIVAVSSNKFVLAAGTYALWAKGVFQRSTSLTGNKLRLYNVTQTSVVQTGMNRHTDDNATWASLMAVFTSNGTDEYRIDHYTQFRQTQGLGNKFTLGTNEEYLHIMLMRLSTS